MHMIAKTAQSKTKSAMAATALTLMLVVGAPSIAEACGQRGFIKTVGTKMLSATKSGSAGSFS